LADCKPIVGRACPVDTEMFPPLNGTKENSKPHRHIKKEKGTIQSSDRQNILSVRVKRCRPVDGKPSSPLLDFLPCSRKRALPSLSLLSWPTRRHFERRSMSSPRAPGARDRPSVRRRTYTKTITMSSYCNGKAEDEWVGNRPAVAPCCESVVSTLRRSLHLSMEIVWRLDVVRKRWIYPMRFSVSPDKGLSHRSGRMSRFLMQAFEAGVPLSPKPSNLIAQTAGPSQQFQ
jgi:hypothetical protein